MANLFVRRPVNVSADHGLKRVLGAGLIWTFAGETICRQLPNQLRKSKNAQK